MPATKRVRVGAVGCGGMPSGVLFPALSAVDEIRLVAVADLEEERAAAAADSYRAERHYTDYREMLDNEDLDGVMIAAPPFVHADVGIEALGRGYHVFTEIPPALTAEHAKRFRDAAAATDRKVLMGTVQRHCPVNRMAREIMSREAFGQPIADHAHYFAPGIGLRMDWGMDRGSDADMFRFFLLDHIIHHLDLARSFIGEIAAVSVARTQAEGEVCAAAFNFRFASGVAGSQTVAMGNALFDNRTMILGDGPACVETHNWTKLTYTGPDVPIGLGGYSDNPIVHWDGGISYQDGVIRPGYREEFTVWARAILDDTECAANLEDGYREMLILDAIVESAETGVEVTVPAAD